MKRIAPTWTAPELRTIEYPTTGKKARVNDIRGKTFGHVTVLRHGGYRQYKCGAKRLQWLCQCNEIDPPMWLFLSAAHLLGKKNVHCGNLVRYKPNARKNIKGRRFGKLVVVRDTGESNRHGKALWECKCDCGNTCVTTAYILLKGEKKSCGCAKFGDYPCRVMDIYRGYVKHANQKGCAFELSVEDFMYLSQQNCHYCGTPPANGSNWRTLNSDVFVYNGIDRVDNTKGYTIDNCVSCCGDCNRGKRDLSVGEFLHWVERVHNHSINKKPEAV